MSRLSKFTTWGWGKQEVWYMHLRTLIILFVLPRLLWNLSYHNQEEGGTPNTLHLHVLHGTSLIFVILSWYYFQVCDTSLGNVVLIYFTNSFQSFVATCCLWYSQLFYHHKLIIICNFLWLHNLLSTWGISTTLGNPKPIFTSNPTFQKKENWILPKDIPWKVLVQHI
jgi:hypothetical protein